LLVFFFKNGIIQNQLNKLAQVIQLPNGAVTAWA